MQKHRRQRSTQPICLPVVEIQMWNLIGAGLQCLFVHVVDVLEIKKYIEKYMQGLTTLLEWLKQSLDSQSHIQDT